MHFSASGLNLNLRLAKVRAEHLLPCPGSSPTPVPPLCSPPPAHCPICSAWVAVEVLARTALRKGGVSSSGASAAVDVSILPSAATTTAPPLSTRSTTASCVRRLRATRSVLATIRVAAIRLSTAPIAATSPGRFSISLPPEMPSSACQPTTLQPRRAASASMAAQCAASPAPLAAC